MEQFDLVEKLVNTFGVSYEKAKEALEASNWNAVDAAVYLEKEKQQGKTYGNKCCDDVKRETKGSFNSPVDEMKNNGCNYFKTFWEFITQNTVVVKKNTGKFFLEIPIWLAGILVCTFFWAIFFAAGILFMMGYSFSFNGPHLGKNQVKNTMNQVENAAKDFADKVKNAVSPDECGNVESQSDSAAEQDKEKKENNSEE